MIVRTKALPALVAVAVATLALPAVAAAQSAGSSGMGAYTAGYGGARYTTAPPAVRFDAGRQRQPADR